MPKRMEKVEVKILEIYKENGETLTELIQKWLNEKYFFGNLNKDATAIKNNEINE